MFLFVSWWCCSHPCCQTLFISFFHFTFRSIYEQQKSRVMVGASWCERSRRSSRLLVHLMLFSRLNVLRCYFANANRPKLINKLPELEVGHKELQGGDL